MVFNAAGRGGRDLYLLDLNRLVVTRITDTPDYETAPAFSPDGRVIVYCAGHPGDRADHLFIRDLQTGQGKQLTAEEANDGSPEFSPDGSRILFTRDTRYRWGGLASSWSGGGAVWSIKRDGSDLRPELPSSIFAISPHLSPDGKRLLWWNTEGVWTAFRGPTSPVKALVSGGGREAVWSPAGDKIAFTRGRYSPDLRVYLMPLASGQTTRVTETAGGCFHPRFAPDGKALYFCVEDWPHGPSGTPVYTLYRVRTDGQGVHIIADSRLFDDPMLPGVFH